MKEIPALRSEHSREYSKEEACDLISEATGSNVDPEYLDHLLGRLPDADEEALYINSIDSKTIRRLISIERKIHAPKEQPRITPRQEGKTTEAKPTTFWRERADMLADQLRPEAEAFRNKWVGKPLANLEKLEKWVQAEYKKENKKSQQMKIELRVATKELEPLKDLPKESRQRVSKAIQTGKFHLASAGWDHLNYPTAQSTIRSIRIVSYNGALFALSRLAKEMSEATNWGSAAHWVGFILTDKPVLSYLRGTSHIKETNSFGGLETAKITLEVDPWVRPDELKTFYKEIKQDLLSSYANRPSDRVFALIKLVRDNPKKKWPQIFALWKKTYPKWKDSFASDNSMKVTHHKAKKLYAHLF